MCGGGDVDGAIADFSQAIKINSKLPEAFTNRGFVQLQRGNSEEAERDLARSVTLRPSLKTYIDEHSQEIAQLPIPSFEGKR